jgi:hypothetical protein
MCFGYGLRLLVIRQVFIDHIPPLSMLCLHFQGLIDIIGATMQHRLVSRLHDESTDVGVAS